MRATKNKLKSNEILEALSESISEIEFQFKKVQELKKILKTEHNTPVKPQGSYLAKYQRSERKHTASMKSLMDFSSKNFYKKLPEVKENLLDNYESYKIESEITKKETQIKIKAERLKIETNKCRNLENELYQHTKQLKDIKNYYASQKNELESQISSIIIKNIVDELVFRVEESQLIEKSLALKQEEGKTKEKYKNLCSLAKEAEKMKNDFELDLANYSISLESLNEQEKKLDSVLEKISKDAKILQGSKHEQTIGLKEEKLKNKENVALEKIQQLYQKKIELETRQQKLEIREKSLESSPQTDKKNTVQSSREKNIISKENSLKISEENLSKEEQEVEAKRKIIMEKWEKIINKADDINKQDSKISINNQEITEKIKEYNNHKKEIELKLSTQEISLQNQENILTRKIKKLQEDLVNLEKKENYLKAQEPHLKISTESKWSDKDTSQLIYTTNDSQDDDFALGFIERQISRKKELEELAREKRTLSMALTSFLSDFT